MLASLKLEIHDENNGSFVVDIPEERRGDLECGERLHFVCSPSLHDSLRKEFPELELLTTGSPFFTRILDLLCQRG